MKHALPLIAIVAACAVAPVLADSPLSFRELEYQQPRDPLTDHFVVYTEVHHSPADQLAPALATLRQAIPVGTPRAEAVAILRKAGAKCTDADLCKYRGIQTVDEYLDEVKWKVRLALADDKVTDIAVERDWQRH